MAGGTISRTPHFVLHRASLDAPSLPTGPEPEGGARPCLSLQTEPWIGAVVPKRWAKRAVTRNGIKRQIYSVSTAFEARLPVAALVVRLRMDFARKEFPSAWSDALKAAVRGELLQLFERVPSSPRMMKKAADRHRQGLPPGALALARLRLPLHADLLRVFAGGARAPWRRRRRLSHGGAHRALPSLVRRRTRSRARRPAPAVQPLGRARYKKRSFHDRHPPHHPLGDLRLFHGDAVGPMAGLQRQAGDLLPQRASRRPPPRRAPGGRGQRAGADPPAARAACPAVRPAHATPGAVPPTGAVRPCRASASPSAPTCCA
jgi:ribonuclease P protein component